MSIQVQPVIGFDTETTGTNVNSDRIVSVALVDRAADGATSTQTWLIDPGVPIPAAAVAIHGLTTKYLQANGGPPSPSLDEVARILAQRVGDGVPVLIYNAPFDLRILDAELARHGLPTLTARLGGPVKPVIDPLVIDRDVDKYRKGGRRMSDLMRTYHVKLAGQLHDPTDDVINSIAVFDAIALSYPSIPSDVNELHDWQIRAHREWANHYNKWLASKGSAPSADPVWP